MSSDTIQDTDIGVCEVWFSIEWTLPQKQQKECISNI